MPHNPVKTKAVRPCIDHLSCLHHSAFCKRQRYLVSSPMTRFLVLGIVTFLSFAAIGLATDIDATYGTKVAFLFPLNNADMQTWIDDLTNEALALKKYSTLTLFLDDDPEAYDLAVFIVPVVIDPADIPRIAEWYNGNRAIIFAGQEGNVCGAVHPNPCDSDGAYNLILDQIGLPRMWGADSSPNSKQVQEPIDQFSLSFPGSLFLKGMTEMRMNGFHYVQNNAIVSTDQVNPNPAGMIACQARVCAIGDSSAFGRPQADGGVLDSERKVWAHNWIRWAAQVTVHPTNPSFAAACKAIGGSTALEHYCRQHNNPDHICSCFQHRVES